MFISTLELFKIGIGPSSSHTIGPLIAAKKFIDLVAEFLNNHSNSKPLTIKCTLKGSLAYTGMGHATDRAVCLGLHGYAAKDLVTQDVNALVEQLWQTDSIRLDSKHSIQFTPTDNVVFDKGEPLPEHPNGMIFELLAQDQSVLFTETYFSIGGGFINSLGEIKQLVAPLKMEATTSCPHPFNSAATMLAMSQKSGLSIAEMKRMNEVTFISEGELNTGLDEIWESMQTCIRNGLNTDGILPGGLNIKRRAKDLYRQLTESPKDASMNDWLCAYAMAVNEENAAGHMVVTAPTNGAAGVIPAVLYYFVHHENGNQQQARDFLLTAAAVGGLIKHRSSISGAEVGCQGEVGTAAAMAAAGLCAVRGGNAEKIENAAEIALEHHLGMTCDPVGGLVQVPCIERNGFGAIKAYTGASLALRGSGQHFMPLDNCIAAMKQTGMEMSSKFKETALGGLAVSFTEC